MGSTRLPGKMLADVQGKPLVVHCLERAKAIPGVDLVVLATTPAEADQPLVDLAIQVGASTYAGSNEDVLNRYYQAANEVNASIILRITGDCPLLDPSVCHEALSRLVDEKLDYVSNMRPPSYPDGLDVEVFTFGTLESAWKDATMASDREHVTQFMWRHPDRYRITNVTSNTDLSHMRWTVDEAEDLEFVRKVFLGLGERGLSGYSFAEVLDVIHAEGLADGSRKYERNEGQVDAMRKDSLDYADEMDRFKNYHADTRHNG